MPEQPSLILSEALLNLVDRGELPEGSDAYLVAQKVVREGEAALPSEEAHLWRQEVVPRLGNDYAA